MNRQTHKAERVVVIGASAGGIEALTQVLSGLPADLPVAILVVQHLRSDRQTHLPDILARHSPLRVCLAQGGMPLEAGVVYVALPGWHLSIEGGHLLLSLEQPVQYVRPSADVLFASAAQAFGRNVIGVVLSGTGRDGARGCQAIKAKGGVTIAQDEKTSRQFAMPRAAIAAGGVDYVLPVRQIAEQIVVLTYEMGPQEEGCHDGTGKPPECLRATEDAAQFANRGGHEPRAMPKEGGFSCVRSRRSQT